MPGSKLISRRDVHDEATLLQYVKLNLGTSSVTLQDINLFKSYFKKRPEFQNIPWRFFCDAVSHCRDKNVKLKKASNIFHVFAKCVDNGTIDISVVESKELDETILDILDTESDPRWRSRLITATSIEQKTKIILEYSREKYVKGTGENDLPATP